MILITGGLGFLGTGLARYLMDRGEEVVLTRRRNSRIPALLKEDFEKVRVVDCDVLDLPSLIHAVRTFGVTSIVHAATAILAKTSLYQAVKTNIEGTVNVLEAGRLGDTKRVTFISSITVYMGMQETVCKETMPIPLDVNQPIASEKIAAEAVCNLYAHEYGLEVIITRPSMIYGPGSFSIMAPLALIVERVLREKKAVMPQFHPEGGSDFVHIGDCSRAVGMIHLSKDPRHRLYNVATGKSHTLKELAAAIKKTIPDCEIELNGPPPYPLQTIDVSRLREEFAYEPEYELERGVREYVDWVVQGRP